MDYLAAKLINLVYAIGQGAAVGQVSGAPQDNDPRARYQMELIIGHGAYGYVYKAWDVQLEKTVAIKVINLEDFGDEIEHLNDEIEIMNGMDCAQLVKYNSSYLVDSKIWIVMEYLEGGSLGEVVREYGPLDEKCVAFVVRELLLALKYLHEDGKIHRDVKAGNVLVSADGAVKLGDFGLSTQLTDNINKKSTRIGSPFWMAPEVIVESKYDGCADIWSLGITCIELAIGLPPHASKVHPMQVIFLIPKDDPPLLEGNFSEEFKDFVSRCLKKEPLERANIHVLLDHPFVQDVTKPDMFRTLCGKRVVDLSNKYTGDLETLENSGMVRVLSTDSGFWDFNSSRRRGYTMEDVPTSNRSSIAQLLSASTSPSLDSTGSQAFKSPHSSSADLISAPLSPLQDPSTSSPTSKRPSSNNSAVQSPMSYSNALFRSLASLTLLTKEYVKKGKNMSSMSFDEEQNKERMRSSLGMVDNKSLLQGFGSLENMLDIDKGQGAREGGPEKELLKRFESMLKVLTQYPQVDSKEISPALQQNHSPLFESTMGPSLQRLAHLAFSSSHDTRDGGNEHPVSSDSKDTNTDSTSSSKAPLEKKQQIQDITAVLIGALSALDVLTDGQVTIEFSTTLVSYMMKELEGNEFIN